jgi:hypothetical protein
MEKLHRETQEQIKHLTWDFVHEITLYMNMVDVHTIDLICDVWDACQNLLDTADYIACSKQTDAFDLDRMRVPLDHNSERVGFLKWQIVQLL